MGAMPAGLYHQPGHQHSWHASSTQLAYGRTFRKNVVGDLAKLHIYFYYMEDQSIALENAFNVQDSGTNARATLVCSFTLPELIDNKL